MSVVAFRSGIGDIQQARRERRREFEQTVAAAVDGRLMKTDADQFDFWVVIEPRGVNEVEGRGVRVGAEHERVAPGARMHTTQSLSHWTERRL